MRRLGLSPKRSTAGELEIGSRTLAPRPDHIADSARATANPPPEMSCATTATVIVKINDAVAKREKVEDFVMLFLLVS